MPGSRRLWWDRTTSCTWCGRARSRPRSGTPSAAWYAPILRLNCVDRESWTAADGRTRGAERVDPGDSEAQLGDAAGGLDGSLWVAFTRSVPVGPDATYRFRESGQDFTYSIPGPKATEVWLAHCAAGSWTRKPITRPGPFAVPVLDLDRSGTLHAAFRGGWFLMYLPNPRGLPFASAPAT